MGTEKMGSAGADLCGRPINYGKILKRGRNETEKKGNGETEMN